MGIGKMETEMNVQQKNSIVYFLMLFLLLTFSIFVIFFQLEKRDLGHFRSEDNKDSLPKTIYWIKIENPNFHPVMQYQYQNYHEYRYSTVVQSILEQKEWLTLYVKNLGITRSYYHKGPVYFWLSALVSKLIGFSKLSVRFCPALFGFLTVIMTFLLAKNIFGKTTALWSLFILTTSFQFIYVEGARAVSVDTIFAFFLVSIVYLLIKQKDSPALFYVASALLGLAGLTRSIFMIIPLLGVFFLTDAIIMARQGLDNGVYKKWTCGALIILMIFSPWIFLQNYFGGEKFTENIYKHQIQEEFNAKIVLARPELAPVFQYNLFLAERPNDQLFYFYTIFKGFFPWSIFVILGLVYMGLICWRTMDTRLLTILFIVGAISIFIYFKEQNWIRYATHLYPFFTIMVAKVFHDFCLLKKENLFLKLGILVTFVVFGKVLIPYNFTAAWMGILYGGILLGLYFCYASFRVKNVLLKQASVCLIAAHFCGIALINMAQPYLYVQEIVLPGVDTQQE